MRIRISGKVFGFGVRITFRNSLEESMKTIAARPHCPSTVGEKNQICKWLWLRTIFTGSRISPGMSTSFLCLQMTQSEPDLVRVQPWQSILSAIEFMLEVHVGVE